MPWIIARIAFDIALADCAPPPMEPLYGPTLTGVYSATLCYRRVPPPLFQLVVIV